MPGICQTHGPYPGNACMLCPRPWWGLPPELMTVTAGFLDPVSARNLVLTARVARSLVVPARNRIAGQAVAEADRRDFRRIHADAMRLRATVMQVRNQATHLCQRLRHCLPTVVYVGFHPAHARALQQRAANGAGQYNGEMIALRLLSANVIAGIRQAQANFSANVAAPFVALYHGAPQLAGPGRGRERADAAAAHAILLLFQNLLAAALATDAVLQNNLIAASDPQLLGFMAALGAIVIDQTPKPNMW